MDAGKQTRIFHFNAPAPADEKPSLQGYSVATWDGPPAGRGAPRGPMRAGSLKVVTTHLLPGYLRKNGVPYSANTVLTEYYSQNQRNQRRFLADHHHHRGRPDLSHREFHHQHELQDGTERQQVDAVTLRSQVIR